MHLHSQLRLYFVFAISYAIQPYISHCNMTLFVQIIAQETNTTARLQTSAQVTINIVNENDNLPTFSSSSYTFELAENSAAGALTSTNPAGLRMIQVSQQVVANLHKFLSTMIIMSCEHIIPYLHMI